MRVKIVIETTLDLVGKGDIAAIEQAGPFEVLQTAKMQGATINLSIVPQRPVKKAPAPAQGDSEGTGNDNTGEGGGDTGSPDDVED